MLSQPHKSCALWTLRLSLWKRLISRLQKLHKSRYKRRASSDDRTPWNRRAYATVVSRTTREPKKGPNAHG